MNLGIGNKYISTDSKGIGLPVFGKIEVLLADGAYKTNATFKNNLIAVVYNGTFEAVFFIDSKEEFEHFKEKARVETWLVHPKAKELAK